MDWKDDEVFRRLNDGSHNCSSVFGVMEESERIHRDIDQEEKDRKLREENNSLLKQYLSEVLKANKYLEKQNNELRNANKNLEKQISEAEEESRKNKTRSIISISVAVISLVAAIISVIISAIRY